METVLVDMNCDGYSVTIMNQSTTEDLLNWLDVMYDNYKPKSVFDVLFKSTQLCAVKTAIALHKL